MLGPRRRENGPSSCDHDGQIWQGILNQMPIGVTVVEIPDGLFILQNSVAREILGREPGPAAGEDAYLHYGAAHEDGRPYSVEEYPLTRAVASGEAVEREPMRYRRPDGGLTILEVNASRITTHVGRQLGVCTFQDVTEEYERRQALREAAERVQLALDAGAIVGTWVWDVQADVFTADELFARSFGLDPERCRTGMSAAEPMVSVHQADRACVEAAVADALARGGPYRCQYRVCQHDGRFRWVEASGWAELDAYGRARRFPGVLLDITAWKHADEARALLMREVDHRSRNVLAMVQSVLRLTDPSDPTRYRDEVVGRVDAMARAQGSLSRTNWEGAVLEEVVRDEVAALAPAEHFHVAGRNVVLAAEQVQPVTMVVHELVTNALKYGALSHPDGRVAIQWRLRNRRDLELTWSERGGPPVTAPLSLGFGSRLIARLAMQLGGAMEMDWMPAGLVATLTWRLEAEADERASSAG